MTIRLALVGVAMLAFAWVQPGSAAEPETSKACCDEAQKVSVQEFDGVEVLEYPWGWIRWLMNGKLDPDAEMTFGMVYVKPNQTNPMHLHPNSAEYLHVLEGSCEHLVGEKWVTLKVGDTVRIPKGVKHCARTRDEACKAVIVYNTGERKFVKLGEGEEN